MEKISENILGLDKQSLAQTLKVHNLELFRTKQIWQWVYGKGARDFEVMTNISKDIRSFLQQNFVIYRPKVLNTQVSKDGTVKFLFALDNQDTIETVYIPEDERGTVCLSSQVGCPLKCAFCHTGSQGFKRNLTVAEILGQLMAVKDYLDDFRDLKLRRVTNVVMMGMGEPLLNYDNVRAAIRIIEDPDGLTVSKRKITLSTAGIAPMIKKCGEDLGVNLALSLHAVTNEKRSQIMPINLKYPLEEVLQACRDYPVSKNSRRITFEYIMLKDFNDTCEDARTLVRLLKGIPAKINLIPFNAWPSCKYQPPTAKKIDEFADILMKAGYASPIRTPRGQDILAACGQLRSEMEQLHGK